MRFEPNHISLTLIMEDISYENMVVLINYRCVSNGDAFKHLVLEISHYYQIVNVCHEWPNLMDAASIFVTIHSSHL